MALARDAHDGEQAPTHPLTAYLFDRAHSTDPAITHVDYTTDRGGVEHTLSWAELASRVEAVTATLTEHTAPGQRVAILARQDPNYVIAFLGALHAGRTAVPLYAPEAGSQQQRLLGALADSAPTVWLTSASCAASVRGLADEHPVPMPKQVLAVDELGAAPAGRTEPSTPALDAPAYLQYTSGSTRAPVGAVISHRAVVTNSWQSGTAFGVRADWTSVGWIPFFHDMGLIQLLCMPVLFGAHSVFMTPFDFIAKPARWLHRMSGTDKVLTAAPNFAYDYATRKIAQRDRESLDLSGVRVMINGSEPVRAGTLDNFHETFAPCGLARSALRPAYGLAEATVFVTNTRTQGPTVTPFDRTALGEHRGVPVAAEDPRAVQLVCSGAPYEQRVCIVDPENRVALDDDTVGEIWVHGPNVADGYWQQPERSAETFDATLARSPADTPRTGWLRTGDLGLLHEGGLYVTGRIKDLIIIDGRNHYPQDIEATAGAAHSAVRTEHVAAFGLGGYGDHESAALVAELREPVAEGTPEHDEIISAVRRAVKTEHDISLRGVVLVPAGGLARTSSGKVARAATREQYFHDGNTA